MELFCQGPYGKDNQDGIIPSLVLMELKGTFGHLAAGAFNNVMKTSEKKDWQSFLHPHCHNNQQLENLASPLIAEGMCAHSTGIVKCYVHIHTWLYRAPTVLVFTRNDINRETS